MKFSVVIPCYNAERWIAKTLDSVNGQTFSPHEVIVVDDGSTDGSTDYLRASSIPTTVLQTQNVGPANARNLGISKATGNWVAFLDADDWWQPEHLERVNNLMAKANDVVYLAAAEHYSINVDRIVSMSDTGPFKAPTNGLDHAAYYDLYLKHGLLELSGMAVRLDRLEDVGGFDEQLAGAEDFELMLRIAHGKTWAYDPVPSSVYRCNNPESYSRKGQTDDKRLTAKFRALLKHRTAYGVPDSLFRGLGRTMMSKAITDYDRGARQRIRDLVYPFLSTSQRTLFTAASQSPAAYRIGNSLRNYLKKPQYRPRKVIGSGQGG